MLDQSGGDKEACVFQPGNTLKSHADYFVVLNDRAAAVAWIDRGIGLSSQIRTITNMAIGLQLNARNDPFRVGDLFATGRISVGRDGRTDHWQIADFEWF